MSTELGGLYRASVVWKIPRILCSSYKIGNVHDGKGTCEGRVGFFGNKLTERE